jgi:hypothetical protein
VVNIWVEQRAQERADQQHGHHAVVQALPQGAEQVPPAGRRRAGRRCCGGGPAHRVLDAERDDPGDHQARGGEVEHRAVRHHQGQHAAHRRADRPADVGAHPLDAERGDPLVVAHDVGDQRVSDGLEAAAQRRVDHDVDGERPQRRLEQDLGPEQGDEPGAHEQRVGDQRPAADPVRQVAGPGVRQRLAEVGAQRDQAVHPGRVAPGLDDVDPEERDHQRQAHRVHRAGERHLPDPAIDR